MSLRQQAMRTRRLLTNAAIVNYGRYMPYVGVIDKLNRRPLFHSFRQKNPDPGSNVELCSRPSSSDRLSGIRSSRGPQYSIFFATE
jgi:hypothetical protein